MIRWLARTSLGVFLLIIVYLAYFATYITVRFPLEKRYEPVAHTAEGVIYRMR